MSEVISIVVVLGIAVALIAVVGHGIWCFLAFLFSSSHAGDAATEKQSECEACPRCTTVFRSGEATCSVCKWPEPLPIGERRLSVVLAVRRQLYLYRQLSLVGEATFRRLIGSLDEHSRPIDEAVEQTTAESAAADAQLVDAELVDAQPVETLERSGIEEEGLRDELSEPGVASHPPSSIIQPQAIPATAAARPVRGKLLSAFLEEKNIRWGELVGGMLIVCCSIALVISFWSEIAQRPLLKFCVFNGVSAAIFAAGLYTNRRWKLHTTSRGLLIVAILLLPLNFLAIAAFTSQSPPTDLLSLAGEGVSLALFTLLSYLAARVLTPDGPWLLALGVMFPSLMQLLTRRYGHAGVPTSTLYALAAAPLVSYVAAVGYSIRPILKRPSMNEQSANRQFILLGIVTFATMLPLGLLLFKTEALVPTLQRIAPLATLAGLPALAMGMLFWRRVTDRDLVREQTAGIGVGVLGAVVMVAALALAWPNPQTLLAASLVNAAAFLLVGVWFAVPQAHVVVGVCLMTATLVAYHVLCGNVAWNAGFDASLAPSLAEAMLSASSGNLLAPLAAAYLAIAHLLRRGNRAADALWWGASAGVVAAVSLALVTAFGFARDGDPRNVTWTYAFFAAALATASFWIERRSIVWTASGLLLVALLQGVVFRYAEAWNIAAPWSAAFLAHASLSAGLYLLARRGVAWIHAALTTSVVAAVLLLIPFWHATWLPLAGQLAWLSGVWLLLAVVAARPRLFAAFQMSLALSLFFGVTHVLAAREWYQSATLPWLDPWFLQTQGVALASYCLIWTALRILAVRRFGIAAALAEQPHAADESLWTRRCRELLEPTWLSFDRLFEAGILVLLLGLSTYAAAPRVAQELAPLDRPGLASRVAPPAEHFALDWMPLEHAHGNGAWMLLAAVLIVLALGLWEGHARWRGIGLLLAAAAACPLAATWWAQSVSGASALRWLVSGYVAAAAIPVWTRWSLRDRLRRMGVDVNERYAATFSIGAFVPTAKTAFALLVTLFVGCHLAMVAYVGVAVVTKSGVPPQLLALFQAFAILAFVAVLLVALIRLAATEGGTSDVGAADIGDEGSSIESGGSSDAKNESAPSLHSRSSILIAQHASALTLFLGIGPLFVTYAFLVASALRQHPLVGPEPDAWFREIGWSVSYGLPLAVFAFTLVGHAIRERSSRIAFAAAMLFNLIATVIYLLEVARLGRPLDGCAWVEVAQVNSIVASAAALAWIAALRWHRDRRAAALGADTPPLACPLLLTTLVLMAAALWTLPMIPAIVGLAIEPQVWPWVAATGGPIGWIAAATAIATLGLWSAWSLSPKERRSVGRRAAGPLAAAAVAFVALACAVFDDRGKWLGYRALLTGVVVASWFLSWLLPTVWRAIGRNASGDELTGTSWGATSTTVPFIGWSSLFGASAVALALRALHADPASPWWTLAALASTAALAVYLAWIAARREFVWIAGVLTPLTASIWWNELARGWLDDAPWPIGSLHVLYVNVIALALVVLVSLVVERRRVLPHRFNAAVPTRGFHRFASWLCIAIVLSTTVFGISHDLDRSPIEAIGWLTASALAATVIAAFACLWDPAARFMVARLWSVGLVAILVCLDARDLAGDSFNVALAVLLSAYALASSLAWNQRAAFRTAAAAWGVPVAASPAKNEAVGSFSGDGHAWMILANGSVAVVATALAFWVDISVEDVGQRTIAATGVLALALSMALLACAVPRTALQCAALALGVLFAIALGWARLPLAIEAPELHRAVVAAVAMALTIPLYALLLARIVPEASGWPRSARTAVGVVTIIASIVLLAVLALEVDYFANADVVPLRWPAVAAVLAALVTLSLASLAAAVLPGRDPLELGQRGRTIYVYAAEILLALAFMHIRVTMPWLFGGWFMRFWPLVVVAIAFLGVGFSELCRRRKLRVLSEPLENTGALLPLLPTIGFWVRPSEVNYSLLLLSVAALYSVLSLLRKSFWFGLLGAVAANGSLWYWLYATEGIGLHEHPQLWLIPPALCVLVAAQLNRARLSDEQMTAIRYLSAIVVYASSTADVFIGGVGEAPWLPVALAGLSLLGIFAGILLRVRAFLYLGTSFLMVALFTVIWYAAVEQDRTWIWWVTGIVAGVLIIALFGLFEKRRDDMLRLVERIKAWEA
ncbi:MAG: hypothetical protein WD875_10000 [Pirellulales bacterium]